MSGNLRVEALRLRSQGWSLDQIYQKLRKPRSTVYYWISHIPLSRKRLAISRHKARLKAVQACRDKRLKSVEIHNRQGLKDINNVSQRELFMIGVALYWAEGSKQREKSVSQRLVFTNNDPYMILIYFKWLDLLKIPEEIRECSLYLHQQYIYLESNIRNLWQRKLSGRVINWKNTVYKHNQTSKPISEDYLGVMRVTILKSSGLNRRVMGWINALCSLT